MILLQIGRRSFSSLARLRSNLTGQTSREFSSGEYVCPISSNPGKTMESYRCEFNKKRQVKSVHDNRSKTDKDEANLISDSSSDNISVPEVGLTVFLTFYLKLSFS